MLVTYSVYVLDVRVIPRSRRRDLVSGAKGLLTMTFYLVTVGWIIRRETFAKLRMREGIILR